MFHRQLQIGPFRGIWAANLRKLNRATYTDSATLLAVNYTSWHLPHYTCNITVAISGLTKVKGNLQWMTCDGLGHHSFIN